MQTDLSQSYAVWLMPRHDEARCLQSLIDDLAKRYGTPSFPAHVTLCSGQWTGRIQRLCSNVRTLPSQVMATRLATSGIKYVDKKFQYFYIAIDDRQFATMSDAALARLHSARLPKPCPHLSLMYCDDFEHVDRKQLALEVQALIPDAIGFDRLACVMPQQNDWSDMASWQEQICCRLTS